MKNFKLNGIILLFIAGLFGKFIGAVYRIPLSNLLGPEGMGLYQMAFPVYSFLLTVITGGISVVLSRKIAISRAGLNKNQIIKDFKVAKNISIFLGIIFFILLIVLAYPLAILQGNINAMWGYFAICIGFVFACILGAYRGFYQGQQNMTPTATSQILEQIFKLVFGIIFASIFVKYNVSAGVCGALVGISFSEIVSYIYFKIITKQNFVNVKVKTNNYVNFAKQIFPVGISYGVLPFSSLIDSFLVVNLLKTIGYSAAFSTSLYGIQTGMILPLVNMPNILISSIAIYAVPSIAYKLQKKDELNKNISNCLRIVYIFILPCTVGLFILSQSILKIIYPSLATELLYIASKLLKFSVFEMFLLCFVGITNSVVLGLGKSKQSFYSLIIGVVVKIILVLFLVTNKNLNIYGLTIASSIGYFVSSFINLQLIKKESFVRVKFLDILLPIFASIVMCAFIVICLYIFESLNIISLVITIFVSALIYFGVLLLFKNIKIKDVKNMLQNEAK